MTTKTLRVSRFLFVVFLLFSALTIMPQLVGAAATLSVAVTPLTAALDAGQSVTFTATATGGSGTYASYQWYVNTVAQTGQTAKTFAYTTTTVGSYSITATVTDNTPTTSAQSPAATATVNALPTCSISATTSTTVVVGGYVQVTAVASGGSGTFAPSTAYSFYVNGAVQSLPGGGGGESAIYQLSIHAAGTYSITCTATDSLGGVLAMSNIVSVTATAAGYSNSNSNAGCNSIPKFSANSTTNNSTNTHTDGK